MTKLNVPNFGGIFPGQKQKARLPGAGITNDSPEMERRVKLRTMQQRNAVTGTSKSRKPSMPPMPWDDKEAKS